MKKLIYSAICILQINFCEIFGQPVFQKTIGSPVYTNKIEAQLTTDGGYIITGTTWNGTSNTDIYLLKTDSAANVQWMKKYGGGFADGSASLQQTSDGGYIVTGYYSISNSGYNGKIFILKTDSNGDTLWTKTYGNPSTGYGAGFIRQTNDHGYIISGGHDNGTSGASDLIKIDSTGNLLWANGYYENTFTNVVLPTDDGGFIVNIPAQQSIFFKTDANGNFLWGKRMDFVPYNAYFMEAMAKTNDGGFILAGTYVYYTTVTEHSCYLVKINSSGDTLWTRAYRFAEELNAYSIQQTNDDGYIVTGGLANGADADEFALKTDSIGNVIWVKKYGGTGNEVAQYVHQLPDGGYIIIGGTQSFGSGNYDVYFIKTDSLGNSGCNDSTLNPTDFVPYMPLVPYNNLFGSSVVKGNPVIITDTIIPQQAVICSSAVSVDEYQNSFTGKNIFPNPFTNEISITLQKHPETSGIKQATFSVKNILGQTVFSKQIQTSNFKPDSYRVQTILDLSFLSKGIYLLEIIIDPEMDRTGGERTVKKIVKE